MSCHRASLALAFIGTLGWIVFVAGFAMRNEQKQPDSSYGTTFTLFCWWAFGVAGFVSLFYTIFAACKPSRCLHTFGILVNIFMLVCSGAIVNFDGMLIYECVKADPAHGFQCITTRSDGVYDFVTVEFAGTLLFVLFQTFSIAATYLSREEDRGYFEISS